MHKWIRLKRVWVIFGVIIVLAAGVGWYIFIYAPSIKKNTADAPSIDYETKANNTVYKTDTQLVSDAVRAEILDDSAPEGTSVEAKSDYYNQVITMYYPDQPQKSIDAYEKATKDSVPLTCASYQTVAYMYAKLDKTNLNAIKSALDGCERVIRAADYSNPNAMSLQDRLAQLQPIRNELGV